VECSVDDQYAFRESVGRHDDFSRHVFDMGCSVRGTVVKESVRHAPIFRQYAVAAAVSLPVRSEASMCDGGY
jgi:hypothetical protein